MAELPEHDDQLIRLAYDVRRLVQGGKYAEMQQLVEQEAERRDLTPWELTHQLAQVGIHKGIARPPQLVPEEDLVQ